MKKILTTLLFTFYVGTSHSEPISIIAASCIIGGFLLKGGEKVAGWWRGDAAKENEKDQALRAREAENDKLKQEILEKRQDVSNLTKRLEIEALQNKTLTEEKKAIESELKQARNDIYLKEKILQLKDAELLECYIKCVQDLSKEQCKHIAQVLLSRGIRSEF